MCKLLLSGKKSSRTGIKPNSYLGKIDRSKK